MADDDPSPTSRSYPGASGETDLKEEPGASSRPEDPGSFELLAAGLLTRLGLGGARCARFGGVGARCGAEESRCVVCYECEVFGLEGSAVSVCI